MPTISRTLFANVAPVSGVVTVPNVVRDTGEGLLVGIWYAWQWGTVDQINTVVWDPTGDNQAMTLVHNIQMMGESRWLAVYKLPNPTSAKTANIVITFAGTNNDGCFALVRNITDFNTSSFVRAGAVEFTNNLWANNSPASNSISSAVNDLVVDFFTYRYSAGLQSAGSGQTNVSINEVTSITMGSSAKPGAATTTMSWHTLQTDAPYDYAHILLSIEPAAGGTPTTISCVVGDAVANGSTAGINGGLTISCTVGSTVAAGSTANVSGNAIVHGVVGNASAGGYTASVSTRIVTDPLVNNTETGPLANTAVHWSWIPAGRIGSLNGITITDGTGTTDANGRLAPGIVRTAGILKVAKRNTNAADDEVFYQAWNS